jgi:aminoglycoside 6'-N-acetyltransferase I
MENRSAHMEIREFDRSNDKLIREAADLLIESFPNAYSDCAMEEMGNCLEEDRVAVMAVDNDQLLGFTGAIPQYGITGWELHPIVVRKDHQFKGLGTKLIRALEKEVALKGGITIYLGTDDEFGKTSLSAVDLYDDTYNKIERIKNFKKHPYEFYQKMGYKIVGVIPDANGIGKPDIWMAKKIVL